MKRLLWTLSYIMAFILAVAAAGYLGFNKSIALIVGHASDAVASTVIPQPVPVYDAQLPTVAILLGNTATESTDFLGPYAMFAEAGIYNVYAVAASRDLRTLTGGLDVVPQLTFAELAQELPQGPDILVIPAMSDVAAPENVPVLQWLRQQGNGHTLLFSWCEGAEVLAASGLIDGKNVTTHWGSIDRYERAYPAVHWQRGERYVDAGTLLTTAGLTSGIDATLHLLEKRNGTGIVAKVSAALHLPASPFVVNPRMQQYALEASDTTLFLNLAFGWPKRRAGIWLYDGIDELDLTAAIDVYEATNHLYTVTDAPSVRSRHGLQFVPRWHTRSLPALHRLIVPGGDGATQATKHLPAGIGSVLVTLLQNDAAPAFAFHLALEDLAREDDRATAAFAAKRLEVRTPLKLVGQRWPLRPLLMLMIVGITGVLILKSFSWLLRSVILPNIRKRN